MDTFETIKKFLSEGGKCLLIENGKPTGVILTIEEYEKLKLLISEIDGKQTNPESEVGAPIENVGTELADIDPADSDDVTLEDLGLDELPY